MFAYHPVEAANLVLNLIDQEARGTVRGIERAVLSFKWRFMGLTDTALPQAIDTLLREGLLRVSGHSLRLTGTGYARLIAPTVGSVAAPREAAGHGGGRPTEYGVRNKLLGVFRTQGLGSGGKLSAGELNRYWEVAGLRAADLRSGLDLLLRDGHSKVGRFAKTIFRLESDGDRYARGSQAPEWLSSEAVALEQDNLRRQGIPDRILCILAARQFLETSGQMRRRALSEVDYLLERYELPEYARFHAFELLHRLGYAEAADGKTLSLTAAGHQLVRTSESEVAQWSIQQAMKAAGSAETNLPRAQ